MGMPDGHVSRITMYHEYSEWKRVYCIFPKTISNTNLKRRGWLYKRVVEVDDCGQHISWSEFIEEKDYFKLKLKGEHKAKSFAA